MRIDDLFLSGWPLISFEFFPPKNAASEAQLRQAIDELSSCKPDFFSITRTGGGTRQTVDLTLDVQRGLGIPTMAHLTCADHTSEQMGVFLDELWDGGGRNVLALRGDPQAGQGQFQPTEGGFNYGSDLVAFARARHDFCIGVAGYPEGHPQSLNPIRDLESLKWKIDAGANFVITQLFFDNADFYRWRDMADTLGIEVPIVAGIMPILSVPQIKRFVTMCGAKIPHPLLLQLESLESDPIAVQAAGVEHARLQCEDLLANGVGGLHFYTLNRSQAAGLVNQALKVSPLP